MTLLILSIATNDDWQTDSSRRLSRGNALAPANPSESATLLQNVGAGRLYCHCEWKGPDPGDWLGGALRPLADIQLYVSEPEQPRCR